ncbi:sugar transferase [Poseidonibacter antarcticus]|uniref:sugar transferase n=1 Tax=Poseidonibacter antarcticus TaxID=2478538 RepID=UPI000EF46586|nr:sugar transferase [Poseidonibacter antarcticus]
MQINKFNLSTTIYMFLLLSMDFLILLFSLEISKYLRSDIPTNTMPEFIASNISNYYWIILVVLFIFILEKIYFIRYDFWADTKRVFKGLILSFIAVFTVMTFAKISNDYSRSFIIIFFLISAFLIPFSKRLFKRFLFRFDIFKIKVKIIANSSQYETLCNEMIENWYFGFKISKKRYDIVLISSKNFEIKKLEKIIKIHSKRTRDMYIIPYMYHLDFSHTNVVDYFNIRLSAIHIENRLLNFKNILIKYVFEKSLVICILPFALLLHLFIAIVIKLDSQGTVFFKQKRFGKNGKIFRCYKYRTMYINGNELLDKYLKENSEEIEYYNIYHKYKHDPRITKIGKFLRATSLDEFPQFFNILRGDMNLIGPRPYMLNEKAKIGKINEDTILKVKPGITGLWQVSGRNELTFKERIELDKWYIQNWSLWMDFVIFMKTINVVLSKVGAK